MQDPFSGKRAFSNPLEEEYSLMRLFRLRPINATRQLLTRGTLSTVIGAILGIISSLIVNSSLVEISVSSFFSLYLGFLFIFVGFAILWRLNSASAEQNEGRKRQLIIFAIMIIVSGILTFLLEQHWFMNLNRFVKIPLYTLLGTSVTFALMFSMVDLINYSVGFFQFSVVRPLIESKAQVYSILLITLSMGAIFGFIFGLMDVEDEVSYKMKLALLREEHYCYPIGAILGGVAGFANEYIRLSEEQLKRSRAEYDELI